MSEPRVLGPASAGWSDYVGTAAAEDAAAVLGSRSLYELAGLDRERWTILGIDLTLTKTMTATVYACDRVQHGMDTIDDIERLGWKAGAIPVHAFTVPHDDVRALVDGGFERLSVRLVAREVRDQALVLDPDDSGV